MLCHTKQRCSQDETYVLMGILIKSYFCTEVNVQSQIPQAMTSVLRLCIWSHIPQAPQLLTYTWAATGIREAVRAPTKQCQAGLPHAQHFLVKMSVHVPQGQHGAGSWEEG